ARKSDRDRRGHCAMEKRLRFEVWCFALSDSIRIPAQTDLQTGAQPLNLLHNLSPCYPICYRGGSRTRHSTYYPGSCGHTRLLQRRLGCLGTLQPMIPLSSLFLASRNRVEPDPAQREAIGVRGRTIERNRRADDVDRGGGDGCRALGDARSQRSFGIERSRVRAYGKGGKINDRKGNVGLEGAVAHLSRFGLMRSMSP